MQSNTKSVAEPAIEKILNKMSLGESVTFVDQNGQPKGVLIALSDSLKKKRTAKALQKNKDAGDWFAQLESLGAQIDKSWTGEKNAVKAIADARQ